MRQVLLNICFVAVALSLFKMLVPENSMKKQTDFLTACFFTASVLFMFTAGRVNLADALDLNSEIIPKTTNFADYGLKYAEAQKKAIGAEIREKVGALLSADGIYPDEIYTVVNISGKYGISINEIRLVFRDRGEETFEIMSRATAAVQREVGESILVSGELK